MKKVYILRSISLVILLLSSLISIRSQNINHWEMVVAANDSWQYFQGNSEPPATWTDNNFDASSWSTGPGGIGYGDGDDGTTIAPVPSVYLRINFNLVDTSIIYWAILHVDYDDAFVAYLNGHEIARANIGTVGLRPSFSDFSIIDHEANMPLSGIPERFIIQKDTLKKYMIEGVNLLALQVHNSAIESSDLSSTTFLSVGIKDASSTYRPVPAWFNDPLNEKTNLPLLMIDTKGKEIVDNPKITASMKIIDNGFGQLNGVLDDATDYDGNIGIEIRGQSSQQFPKKNFAVELWNNAGLDTSVSILGMPTNSDWVLSAPYSDKSMLRNALTYHLGRKMGAWQPRFKFCEVYMNGSYHGVYMVIEKIKRDSNRVDINKLKPDEISGDNLTGGYIVKVDKTWDLTTNEYFTSYPSIVYPNSRYYNFTYVYPKSTDIVPAQKTYIRNYITSLENILNGDIFKDPIYGFRKYMDMNSFIDFQIMNELVNNVDGYRYSTFFYKKRDSDGGKLFAGPLWDFDLCYGNVDYSPLNLATDNWLYPKFGTTENYPMHWWARLMQDPDYSNAFSKRWKELRSGPFKTDSIMAYLNDTIQYLGNAVDRNFVRWPILGTYQWPNYFVGSTYLQEVNYLETWIKKRLEWMDNQLLTGISVPNYRENNFSVYPNPVNNKMTIVLVLNNTNKIEIEMLDLLGKKVFTSDYSPISVGNQTIELSIPKMASGYYMLKMKQKEQIIGMQKLAINN